MDKVSIITTFYNCERFLKYALTSVIQQKTNKLFNIEYILVNDCSTDNGLIVAEDFIETYKNVKNINIKLYTPEHNLGCGAARKYGIEKATGDYFMFLDADDYYLNNDFVLRAYKTITEEEADIVEYGVLYHDIYGNNQNLCVPERLTFTNWHDSIYWMFKNNTVKFNVWSKIYTKEIVHSFPYDTTREYEDIRTIPVWVMNANKLIVEPSIEINYRASQNTIIRDNGMRTRLGTITAMTEMCEYFKEDIKIVKALYNRAMIDICNVMDGKSSFDEGFDEMSKLNTKLLSYIYPDTYKDFTYNVSESKDNKNNILNNNKNDSNELIK